jgi:hypothetical protein
MTQACKDQTPFGCLEQFRRIDERLAALQAQMESGVAEIRAIYEAQGKRLDRAEQTLYGNGAAGLCTKVSAILWLSSAIAGFVVLLLSQTVAAWVK